MKHLLGAAFVIAVVILIIIGLTTDEPMPMTDMEFGMMEQAHHSDSVDH